MHDHNRTKKELLQDLLSLRTLTNNSSDLLYQTDQHGIITFINDTGLSVLDISRENAVGTPILQYFHSDDLTAIEHTIQNVMATGRPCTDFECRLIRQQGDALPARQTLLPLHDSAHAIIGIQAVIRFACNSNQAELALQQNQELFNASQRITNVGSWEYNFQNGTTHWSDELYRLQGYDPAEIPPSLDRFMARVHPDDRHIIQNAYDTHETHTPESLPQDLHYRIISSDGTIRHVIARNQYTYDSTGIPLRIYGTIQDISDRINIEKKMREGEERWQFALEGSGDGIWDRNIETGEVFFSKRWKEIIGFNDADLTNQYTTWEMLVHPEDLAHVKQKINATICGESDRYVAEYRMRCKNGSWKWILARGKIIASSSSG
ncbi:MAG: PAS domain-containing protein, partial [Deltaproteobacteria bacterium]|nr:PAS domain-containing protein [Deltaproteobacteria bacterium]